MKRLFVVVVAVLLAVGVVTPAQADADRHGRRPPSTPTAVAVTSGPGAQQATLTWAAPERWGGYPLFGYSIMKKAPNEKTAVYWQKGSQDPAKTFTKTFSNLEAGVHYTFIVTAWNHAGVSRKSNVQFTLPVEPAQPAVFAFDTVEQAVLAIPSAGESSTVATGVSSVGLEVNATGDLYNADPVAGTVTEYPSAGGAAIAVATGLENLRAIELDEAGNLYIWAGRQLLQAAPGSAPVLLFTAPADVQGMTVSPAGTVSISYSTDIGSQVVLVTIPAAGTPVQRVIECQTYCFDLRSDSLGTVYVNQFTSGASGFSEWGRLAATAVSTTELPTNQGYYAAAVDAADTFYLLHTNSFCARPNEPPQGTCIPDRTVPDIARFAPDGSALPSVPVTGLTLPEDGADVAVSASGSIYVASSAGLLLVPAAGGAAQTAAAGSFSQLALAG